MADEFKPVNVKGHGIVQVPANLDEPSARAYIKQKISKGGQSASPPGASGSIPSEVKDAVLSGVPSNVRHSLSGAAEDIRQGLEAVGPRELHLSDAPAIGVNFLPSMGAGIGGGMGEGIASIPLAAAGGALGEAARQVVVKAFGQNNLSGPDVKVDPVPDTWGGRAKSMGAEALEQGAFEGGGKLVGGIIRGLTGGPYNAVSRNAANATIKHLNNEYGLKLTGPEITGKWKRLQFAGELGMFGQDQVQKRWGESVSNGVKAINTILDRMSPPSNPTETGQAVQGMLKVSKDIFDEEAGKRYTMLDQEAKGVTVDMEPLQKIAAQRLATKAPAETAYPDIGGYGKSAKQILENIVNGPPKVPFLVAQQVRTNLRNITPQTSELMGGEAKGVGSEMVGKLTTAMDDAGKKLNPKARDLWNDARKFYAEGATIFDHASITALISKEPEEVAKAIKEGGLTTARRIRSAVMDYADAYGTYQQAMDAKETWGRFQDTFMRSNIVLDPENTGKQIGIEQLAGMKDRIDNYGPRVMEEIFGKDQAGKIARKNITDISEAFSRIQKLPAGERIGAFRFLEMMTTATVGWFSGSDVIGHLTNMGLTAAALEGTPWLITKAIRNETATRYVLDGLGGVVDRVSKSAGKRVLKVQEKYITSPQASKSLNSAISNFARAYEIVEKDYNGQASKPNRSASPPGADDMIRVKSKDDIFKDWEDNGGRQ